MSKLRESLTRKLGPLPVWAWALIAGAAIFVYRTRRALGTGTSMGTVGGSSSRSPDTDAENVGGGGGMGGGDPVTLGPGESVYDPNTGHLIGTAPEQAPNDAVSPPVPQEPVVLGPGEQVYDPNTGKVSGGAAPKKRAGKRAKIGKRKPKHKAQHKGGKKVPHHGGHKKRARSFAKLVHPLTPKRTNGGRPKARVRGKSPSLQRKSRARAHVVTPHPVMRQHTTSPRVVHPGTQRVEKHPQRPHPHPTTRKKRHR